MGSTASTLGTDPRGPVRFLALVLVGLLGGTAAAVEVCLAERVGFVPDDLASINGLGPDRNRQIH